jgi:hypothetical protein
MEESFAELLDVARASQADPVESNGHKPARRKTAGRPRRTAARASAGKNIKTTARAAATASSGRKKATG